LQLEPQQVENSDLVKKLADFETKKSVHVSMTKDTHAQFRKKLFDFDLSMQEVLELFANLAGENDDRAIDIMKEAKKIKRSKAIKKLSTTEMENVYDAISEIDPFTR
jgi:hypothetical protein